MLVVLLFFSALVKEKEALALKREREEKTRREQEELEKAFEKKSVDTIPDHVRVCVCMYQYLKS